MLENSAAYLELLLNLRERRLRGRPSGDGRSVVFEEHAKAIAVVREHRSMCCCPIIFDHTSNRMDVLFPAKLLGSESHARAQDLE